MAQFCTKCGAPLAEGMKFCTGCGATQGGPSAPVAQAPAPAAPPPAAAWAPPAPAAAAPVAPVAAAPAASSGSPVMKIILVVLAVIIFISLLGAGACVYMIYRTKQKISQFETKVQSTFPVPTGTGQVPTQPAAPAIDIAGVPIYPGAAAKEGTTEVNVGVAGLKVRQFTTSDSVDKVVAFYKDKMGSQAMVTQNGQQALVQVVGSNGVINVAIGSDSGSGITKITIQSISK